MEFSLSKAHAILARTPATLASLLTGLDDEWTRNNEGGDSWSPFDIVGHLIHGEKTDWMGRVRILLDHGEAREFDPFDRFAQFDADQGRSLEELLEEFAQLRRLNLQKLDLLELEGEDFDRTGRHPALGRVTLEELLATWVVHDLGHIAQIARVMAKQYGDRVGPWREYLSVLGDRVEKGSS